MIKLQLAVNNDVFTNLAKEIKFEPIIPGRKGAILVKQDSPRIVRTTTKYVNPAQFFSPLTLKLITRIESLTKCKCKFNNILAEQYDTNYQKMKYHSDQALDLVSDSVIALFSCYENPDDSPNRLLRYRSKKAGSKPTDIILDHGSVVFFSTETNSHYLHKIILDQTNKSKSRWIGLTMRLSKTPKASLRLATDAEIKEFYKLRSVENKIDGLFEYPTLDYTISKSDLLDPID